MSDIKFSCPNCGQHISCDSASGGAQINCPACQTAMVVPGGPAPVPVAPPLGKPCPGCGTSVAPGAVICTNCGMNLRTGRRIGAALTASAAIPKAQASWLSNPKVWLGLILAVFGVLLLLGRSNPTMAAAYHMVLSLFALGVQIMILIAAFQDSVGQGFLTLCVPCYVLYFVFVRCDSTLIKTLFLMLIVTALGGLLVKLPEGLLE